MCCHKAGVSNRLYVVLFSIARFCLVHTLHVLCLVHILHNLHLNPQGDSGNLTLELQKGRSSPKPEPEEGSSSRNSGPQAGSSSCNTYACHVSRSLNTDAEESSSSPNVMPHQQAAASSPSTKSQAAPAACKSASQNKSGCSVTEDEGGTDDGGKQPGALRIGSWNAHCLNLTEKKWPAGLSDQHVLFRTHLGDLSSLNPVCCGILWVP